MRLSPDEIIFWQYGFLKLNATIVVTWGLMLILAIGSRMITLNLSKELARSRGQNLLEIIVTGIEKQLQEVGLSQPRKYLSFLGTLFLFIAAASLFNEAKALLAADHLHHTLIAAVALRHAIAKLAVQVVIERSNKFRVSIQEHGSSQNLQCGLHGGLVDELAVLR